MKLELFKILLTAGNEIIEGYVSPEDSLNEHLLSCLKENQRLEYTELNIDKITLKDYTQKMQFNQNQDGIIVSGSYQVNFNAILFNNDVERAVSINIDNPVRLIFCNAISYYDNGNLHISNCKMSIPYNSLIEYGIINDIS